MRHTALALLAAAALTVTASGCEYFGNAVALATAACETARNLQCDPSLGDSERIATAVAYCDTARLAAGMPPAEAPACLRDAAE